MRLLTVLPLTMLALIFTLGSTAQARYIPCETIIANNNEAQTKCPETCSKFMTNWTGSWWTSNDPVSVCECFHDNPACFFKDVIAGAIFTPEEARDKCPKICGGHYAQWTGDWTNIMGTQLSLCSCKQCY